MGVDGEIKVLLTPWLFGKAVSFSAISSDLLGE